MLPVVPPWEKKVRKINLANIIRKTFHLSDYTAPKEISHRVILFGKGDVFISEKRTKTSLTVDYVLRLI